MTGRKGSPSCAVPSSRPILLHSWKWLLLSRCFLRQSGTKCDFLFAYLRLSPLVVTLKRVQVGFHAQSAGVGEVRGPVQVQTRQDFHVSDSSRVKLQQVLHPLGLVVCALQTQTGRGYLWTHPTHWFTSPITRKTRLPTCLRTSDKFLNSVTVSREERPPASSAPGL